MENKQLEGFFISFTKEESGAVREALEHDGYEPDGRGLKRFILDSMTGDDEEAETGTDRFIRKARQFVADHPETVRFGIKTIEGLAKRAKIIT